MPMWDAGQAVDREAHNEYLSSIDEAFGMFLQGVETARDGFEGSLESARVALEVAQAQAAATHGRAIDAAWAGYKQQVASSAATARAREIAEARSRYLQTSAEARHTLDEARSAAREVYLRSVHEARLVFEAAVENEFAAHRDTLMAAGKYLEGSRGGHIRPDETPDETLPPPPAEFYTPDLSGEAYYAPGEEPSVSYEYSTVGEEPASPFEYGSAGEEPVGAYFAGGESGAEHSVPTAVYDEDEDDVILEGINPD